MAVEKKKKKKKNDGCGPQIEGRFGSVSVY